jgi:hypothetical protein
MPPATSGISGAISDARSSEINIAPHNKMLNADANDIR